LVMAFCCALSACNSSTSENPGSPLWGGFDNKTAYILTDDVFLLSLEQDGKTSYALSPPGEKKLTRRLYNAPRTLTKRLKSENQKEDYVDGKFYNLKTVALGVVRRGTTMKIVDVLKERKFSWFFGEKTIVTINAQLLNGEYSGKVVDIRDISVEDSIVGSEGMTTYKFDPAFLKPGKGI